MLFLNSKLGIAIAAEYLPKNWETSVNDVSNGGLCHLSFQFHREAPKVAARTGDEIQYQQIRCAV